MLWVKAIRQVCVLFFFKVDDLYESYIDNLKPLKYVRKINEGGYVKTKRVFNQADNSVFSIKTFVTKNTQDILSAFYYCATIPILIK
jgi:hypothetical protein